MGRRSKRRSFSLIEVVLAVGVFAVAVTVVLALLPGFARQGAESADQLVAEGLAGALRSELSGRARRDGFTVLANSIPVMSPALDPGFALVAPRDGSLVEAPGRADSALSVGSQYFQIEMWRFSQPPLAYDLNGATLAVFVRVSWPYRVFGAAAPTPLSERSQLTFATAINR